MSKLHVVCPIREIRIPFLRGMLVKSLQQAGLGFDDAYRLAQNIRDELDNKDEVSTVELREKIESQLKKDFPGTVLRTYKKDYEFRDNIQVIHETTDSEPFSRGIHVKRLQRCAIGGTQSNAITRKIHSYLIKNKIRRITSHELASLTYKTIYDEIGQKYADYYLMWRDFQAESRPLLLLIGGVPGCGKSTIATEAASRLDIVRTQSTDTLREVMRIMIPEKLSPVLHTSSFEAGQALHLESDKTLDEHNLMYGFALQSDMVEVACEAVIKRALNENVSMVIEGVHIRPTLLNRIDFDKALVVPVFLAVLDKKRLLKFIKGRSRVSKQRRAKRYLENIDDIWQMQSILVSEADNHDIDIIDNKDITKTTLEIMDIIVHAIAKSYKGKISALRKQYR